jgi:predicted house-cleaning noncanonical NTP pyrophosphatase (MazG superfamily)
MSYRKLVRDKIPEMLDEKGISYTQTIALAEEYKAELIAKLREEIDEFAQEGDIEELADVIEVVEALKKLPEYTDVETVRLNKLDKRGGFEKRLILEGEKD